MGEKEREREYLCTCDKEKGCMCEKLETEYLCMCKTEKAVCAHV